MSGPSVHPPAPPLEAPTGLDLRLLFRTAWAEKRRIAATTLATMLITLGVAFLLPKWYRATAVILPPEETDLFSNLSMAQRALTKFPAFGVLPDFFTPADIYKAILESRMAQEELVHAFDLQKVYRQKSLEKTLKALKDHTRVKLNSDGTIKIEVEDRDRRRAAEMANALVTALDRYNVEKRNTQAHRTRIFLERRVAETDSLLLVCERLLKEYQEHHHTVVPPTTSAGDIKAASDLMARKIMLEIQLGLLRGYLREDNEQVVQTRVELDELNRRVSELPQLTNDLVRLTRDAKIQEQLYLLLTAELEQARIRETMDTPTVQVLDRAQPPERHSRPRKMMLAIGAGLVALLGSLTWLAFRQTQAPVPEA